MDGAPAETSPTALAAEIQRAPALHLLVDYDGTLVPFAPVPSGAAPDDALLALLGDLAARPRVRVTVVSGRDRDTLAGWLGAVPGLRFYAEHGRWRFDGAAWRERVATDGAWLDAARPSLVALAAQRVGAFVEEKGRSLVLHHRLVVDDDKDAWVDAVIARARTIAPPGVRVEPGSGVVDVRADALSKAVAVADALAERAPGELIVALGDDRTDEDMFLALDGDGVAVCVGPGETSASRRLADPAAVRALLRVLAG